MIGRVLWMEFFNNQDWPQSCAFSGCYDDSICCTHHDCSKLPAVSFKV